MYRCGSVIFHRARADGRGGVVNRSGHHLHVRRQAQRLGHLGLQRAQHRGTGHDLGQFVGVDAAVAHQPGS